MWGPLPGIAIIGASFLFILWLRPRLFVWSDAAKRRLELEGTTDDLRDDEVCSVYGDLVCDGPACLRLEDGAEVAATSMEDGTGAARVTVKRGLRRTTDGPGPALTFRQPALARRCATIGR